MATRIKAARVKKTSMRQINQMSFEQLSKLVHSRAFLKGSHSERAAKKRK